jgi:DNA-binding NarL/FixJ family response regulator
MNSEHKTTLMLVDDHAVVRAGYKRYIELDPQLVVVAEASTGEEAYGLLDQLSADVVIMDLSMPGQGGFETLRRILNRYPSQKVMIFSMHENASIANQALRLGASGYLTKNMPPDQIIAAIHQVMQGGKPVAPDLQAGLAELNSPNLPHNELLPREFEVLVLLASGETIDSISARLHLSSKTASNYQANIRKKLGVSSSMELQRYAKEHGLIS